MRQLGLGLLVIAALALPPTIQALGAGSQLEAAAPVALDGRVDSLLPAGIASLLGDGAPGVFVLALQATELNATFHVVAPACSAPAAAPLVPTGGGCDPTASPETRDAREQVTLRDATVRIGRPTGAYQAVVTTDSAYRDTTSFGDTGRLVVTTAAATKLDAAREAFSLDASTDGWEPDEEAGPQTANVYAVEAGSSILTATGATLAATGGFETFLQGVRVTVEGRTADGKAYSRTFETTMPRSEEDPFRYVEIEASGGVLSATSTASFVGFVDGGARPVFDVHTRAHFQEATGKVVDGDGDERTYDAPSAVTLEGPLSLTLTKVLGDKGRLAFAIADGLHIQDVPTPDEEKPLDAAQLAAAGAAGAGGAGALIALAYFWPRLKFAATLLALPLYSRIERQDVLEHGKRDEIYELIRASPGIHAHDVGEKAQIGWGTTVYHLKLLESHGLVVSKKSGRYKRFFVNTGEYTKKKDLYGALRNDTAKAVANYIAQHPGTSQKDLCAALGIQPSLASWHVEKLEGVGLVKRMKDGRQVRYFAGPSWSELQPTAAPTGDAQA